MAEVSIGSLVIDVNDLGRMKDFWRGVLDYEVAFERDDWVKLSHPKGEDVNLSLQLVPEHRDGKNRLHLDLYSHQPQAEIERIVSPGGRGRQTSGGRRRLHRAGRPRGKPLLRDRQERGLVPTVANGCAQWMGRNFVD